MATAEKPPRINCQELTRTVYSLRNSRCSNEAKVERDGKHYCLIHDPVARKARDDARREKQLREIDERIRSREAALAANAEKAEQARAEYELMKRKAARWDYVERLAGQLRPADWRQLLTMLRLPSVEPGEGLLAHTIDYALQKEHSDGR